MSKKMTKEEFIEKAKKVHGDKYDYSLVDYFGNKKKVKIIYNNFIYEQRPDSHLSGREPDYKTVLNNDEFIEKAKEVHGDKYDYSKTNYISNSYLIDIIYEGKVYKQNPYNHLMGQCPEKKVNRLSNDEFIKRAKEVHGDKYNYDLVDYFDSHTEIDIIYEGKVYKQKPYNHLSGRSPKGTENKVFSKGEISIEKYLIENKISYQRQYKIEDCRNILPLPFDFYLPELNILIEYDGKQHFESIDLFGGEIEFKKRKKNDDIKNKYCKKNKIPLLRIPYFEDVDLKLNDYLKSYLKS
jgi:hypothetical protein